MRLSTATVSLSGDLTGKMQASARAGFDGIELFEPDLVVAEEPPEEIRALARRLGLRLDGEGYGAPNAPVRLAAQKRQVQHG